jgi:hypothetical protein
MALPENFLDMRPRDKEHYKNIEFNLWWDANKDRIEKRDRHSFSGMVRLSQSPDYYRLHWDLFIFNRPFTIHLAA